MAINFPSNPTIGQIHTSGSASFIWDGDKWKSLGVNVLARDQNLADLPNKAAAKLNLGIVPMQLFQSSGTGDEGALQTSMTNRIAVDFTPTTSKVVIFAQWSADATAVSKGVYHYSSIWLYNMTNSVLFHQSAEVIGTRMDAGYEPVFNTTFFDGLGIGIPYKAWLMIRVNQVVSGATPVPVYPRVMKIWGFTHE